MEPTVARKVFYSFHFDQDSHRVSQVKSMGVVEGQPILSSNEWEDVKKRGDSGIKAWIDSEMRGKSCLVVLIGSATAKRRWVDYEIQKAWNDGKGVVGIYIHNLKNLAREQTTKGGNPFAHLKAGDVAMSSLVTAWDPSYSTSTYVYDEIKAQLPILVDKAIHIRTNAN